MFRGLPVQDKMGWILGLEEGVLNEVGKQTWRKVSAGLGRLLYKRDRLAEAEGIRVVSSRS